MLLNRKCTVDEDTTQAKGIMKGLYFLKQKPVFLLLLPFFFVFHGFVENYDLIPFPDVLLLFLLYSGYSLLIFLFFLLIFRNMNKAALAAFLAMFFYFFFGYLYDNIWELAPHSFFSKYSFILGSMGLTLAGFCIYLFFSGKNFQKLSFVLSFFLILMIAVDLGWFILKLSRLPVIKKQNFPDYVVCDTCPKPDVFLILTDGYPGDKELNDLLDYDNSDFKTALRKRGFHTPASISNYNYTPFSIGSLFKMDYLDNIRGIDTDPRDLSICFKAMREANLFKVLESHGYELHNYSLFDIYKSPSPYSESRLPGKTKFITSNTLFNRVEKNLLYNNNAIFQSLKKKRIYLSYHNNKKALDATFQAAGAKATKPRFIYAHLEMPHYPYYFDSKGNPVEEENLLEGKERDTTLFREYLQYTNKKILQLVDSIMVRSDKPPVILLVSDHGYRELPFRFPKAYEFNNSVAVYFPNQDYKGIYEGISNVNLVRQFLNIQFKQQLPLLKDSMITVVIK